jgi:cytochrome c-type biogenesis protein CcmF
MIAELGQLALIGALFAAALSAALGLHPRAVADAALGQAQRRAALVQGAFVAIAFGLLVTCFLRDDFSVLYVATNSNTALPTHYKVAAVWGAHEGSLLLWALLLSAWVALVAWRGGALPVVFRSRMHAALGLVSVGFLTFMLFTSNPFARLLPAALQGRDLNPLLQDPAMAMHPPILYVGYVGMAVPFAFAIAALLEGRVERDWVRWLRTWVTVAWIALTVGIALGSWWAYYELGWGGWWFWDPVENASFMPWLLGTALLHSLIATEKRGAFVGWSLLLAIAAFALSLLGTFLVRSGVLVSVHAFATDPLRGVFILAFLVAVVGGALALYAWRAPKLAAAGGSAPLSRETFLLLNNALLVTAAAAVLLGTLYPLFLDALDLGRISVGPPFFNAVFVPLMLPLLAAVGVGAVTRWGKDDAGELGRRLRPALLIAVVVAVLLMFAFGGPRVPVALLGVALGAWTIAAAGLEPWRLWRSTGRVPLAVAGMGMAHFGVGVTALGIALVASLGVERDVALSPGVTVEVVGHEITLDALQQHAGPNFDAVRATVTVTLPDGRRHVLHPEKRNYRAGGMPMTEAAIDAGIGRDLYVALGEPVGEGAWSARVQIKPAVRWIWLGALFMALGGLLAIAGRRRAEVPA